MADIDVDPFGELGKTDKTTDETFPLTPRGGTDVQIHTSGEQETLFGGTSLRTKVLKDRVEELYQKLSERKHQNPEVFHFDLFEIRDWEFYYKDKSDPLTIEGKLRPIDTIADILGKKRHRDLGFDIPNGKLTA